MPKGSPLNGDRTKGIRAIGGRPKVRRPNAGGIKPGVTIRRCTTLIESMLPEILTERSLRINSHKRFLDDRENTIR